MKWGPTIAGPHFVIWEHRRPAVALPVTADSIVDTIHIAAS